MKLESKKSIISIFIAFVLVAAMLFGLAGVRNHLSASAEEADNYKTNVSISTDKAFVRPGDTFELTVSFSTNRSADEYSWNAISCSVSPLTTVNGAVIADQTICQYLQPETDEYGIVVTPADGLVTTRYSYFVLDKFSDGNNAGLQYNLIFGGYDMAVGNVLTYIVSIKVSEDMPAEVTKIDWGVRAVSLNAVSYFEIATSKSVSDRANQLSFVPQGCTVILTDSYMTDIRISSDKVFVAPGDTVKLTTIFSTNRPSNFEWDAISATLSPVSTVNGTIEVDQGVCQYIEPVIGGRPGSTAIWVTGNNTCAVLNHLDYGTAEAGLLYTGSYATNRIDATEIFDPAISIKISEDLPADITVIQLTFQRTSLNLIRYFNLDNNKAEYDRGNADSFVVNTCSLIISR